MFSKSLLYSLILSTCVYRVIYSEGIALSSEDNSQKFSYLDFPLTLTNQAYPENSYGLMHDTSEDIVISNDKQPKVFISLSNVENGGVISCRSCHLTNNTQPVFFGDNRATNNGGAISSTENVIISKNARIIFYQNSAFNQKNASGNSAGGAVYGKNFEASFNNKEFFFISNLTKTNGGAICSSETCKFLDNASTMRFDNNRGYHINGLGGAIYTKSCEFTRNTGEILFNSNKAGKGGAIYSTTSTSITDNYAPITFFSNAACNGTSNANGNGGAINSVSLITIKNNKQSLIFDGNSAAHAGGALSYQNLTIENNGPVYFFNNTACWGGAFYGQTDNGTTKISADHGNIIFDNNIAIDRVGVWRSAMFFSSNHTLSLGATQNQHIYLFDTIDTRNLTSFIINPEAKHTGAVVFSGAKVQSNLSTNVRNVQTSYGDELTIKHGIISVENGARLSVYKITSEDNTHFCLGRDVTIKTQQKSDAIKDSNLQIKNVAILLTEVLNSNSPPTIWIYPGGSSGRYTENTDAKISILGSLSLWNEYYRDPYDSVDLSQSIDRVPLLHLSEIPNNLITTNDFDIHSINSHKHYGHQGIWTPYWEEIIVPSITTSLDTTNSKHRYLYANWMPTGYTVNPQHRADLVANTLWQTAYSATAFYPSLINESSPSFYLQGQGLGTHRYQKDKDTILGFSSRSLGYSGECLLSSETNCRFLLTFSQISGKMKEHISKNKIDSHSYLLGLSLQMPWFNEHLITTASLSYCYGDHHMQSFYTQNKQSKTEFRDHALSARIGCYLHEKLAFLNHYFTPFIQLRGVRVEQTKINETGDFPRKFSNQHPLIDIALPIGIQTFWLSDTYLANLWEFQLAYQPSIYRQKPKVLTTLLASNGSWTTSGSPVARHNLHVEGRNSIHLLHNIIAFLNYQLDLSSSTTSHYVNAGSRVVF
ncbi:polymorphic outer membrane protein middle domain-containing protein [Chlamydia sp. 04-14]|uniref:polymorphic outer membrane protein middle domain-containing protein n=1 Tax=Chlamydia TaxID=810 RepID=UPI002FC882F5